MCTVSFTFYQKSTGRISGEGYIFRLFVFALNSAGGHCLCLVRTNFTCTIEGPEPKNVNYCISVKTRYSRKPPGIRNSDKSARTTLSNDSSSSVCLTFEPNSGIHRYVCTYYCLRRCSFSKGIICCKYNEQGK